MKCMSNEQITVAFVVHPVSSQIYRGLLRKSNHSRNVHTIAETKNVTINKLTLKYCANAQTESETLMVKTTAVRNSKYNK